MVIHSSEVVYLAIICLVGLERVVELLLSHRNARLAFEQGGVEVGKGHYGVMRLLHSAFLVACPAEVFLFHRPLRPWLFGTMFLVVCGTMALRYWAISTLGTRWNTRVIVVPGLEAVNAGPYRFLRHPNYVAVVLELAALPLMHGAWITALGFSLANLVLLKVRIDAEEEALREHCGYATEMEQRPRVLP